MAETERMAEFVTRASFDALSEAARRQLKIRVLDSLGCAIGALDGDPILTVRAQLEDFGGSPLCTVIGGRRSAPDRVALMNGALVRYLDFNDSYLAPGETGHPSDNVAPVLAAAEYAKSSGRDFLAALAVAYQVQCRLSDVAPVRAKGFDHTVQGSYAVASGVSRALGLDVERTANAIGICGTAFNALRVTRTGELSHWKGLAYPNTSFGATHATFLAMRGITGPKEVFEGNKGFMDSIAGKFSIDWSQENLEIVTRTILKRYNAEIHSQSTLEGVLELKSEHGFDAEDVLMVEVDTFDVAYDIIGGGEEGNKKVVRTKEQADHSIPYMVAVAILDGEVMPPQYLPQRIIAADVQALLQKVLVRPSSEYSRRFPEKMPCRVTIRLRDGRVSSIEKDDYEGFHTRPMRWETLVQKFRRLCTPFADDALQGEIIAAVDALDSITVSDLTSVLARVAEPGPLEERVTGRAA